MPTVTAKTENYTPEMTQEIVGAYTGAGTDMTTEAHAARAKVVKDQAVKHGKSERSIRSKLVTQKVYIKKAEKSKVTGETPEKKEVLAQRLVAASGLKVTADSIQKMNKTDIQAFLTFFNNLVVEESDEPADEIEGEPETADEVG